jgi:hypothetical protein
VALTDSSEVVATFIADLLSANKASLPTPVQDVWYGDQQLLPHTPAICVAPGMKTREFQGASLRTLNVFETLVWVYFCKLQDVQENLHGCTAVMDAVDYMVQTNNGSDNTLGGIVTSVICMQSEPGIATKQGALMMAARLAFRSQSKTMLLP